MGILTIFSFNWSYILGKYVFRYDPISSTLINLPFYNLKAI